MRTNFSGPQCASSVPFSVSIFPWLRIQAPSSCSRSNPRGGTSSSHGTTSSATLECGSSTRSPSSRLAPPQKTIKTTTYPRAVPRVSPRQRTCRWPLLLPRRSSPPTPPKSPSTPPTTTSSPCTARVSPAPSRRHHQPRRSPSTRCACPIPSRTRSSASTCTLTAKTSSSRLFSRLAPSLPIPSPQPPISPLLRKRPKRSTPSFSLSQSPSQRISRSTSFLAGYRRSMGCGRIPWHWVSMMTGLWEVIHAAWGVYLTAAGWTDSRLHLRKGELIPGYQ